jgi:phospholipase/carboxylesterase
MLDTVWIKAGDKASRRLMVVLHGLGDSDAGYRWLPGALQLDWMHYLLVNAPDPYFGGFSWYDIYGEGAPGVLRSRALLFELLDEQRRCGFPTELTTIFGFSQGCLMAWEMGLRYPDRFAGLAGISGYAHDPEKTAQEWSAVAYQQRFLITHGIFDPLIPFAGVRKQIQWLKTKGLSIEWHEFEKEHTIAGEEELAIIRNFVVKGYPA